MLLSVPAGGQEESPWAAQLERFSAQGMLDSLEVYYRRQAEWHRSRDELEGWLYSFWDLQAEVFDDPRRALAVLDTALQGAWRPPRDAAEAEAMLWVQVNRGYHLFRLGRVTASLEAYEEALRWYRRHPPPDFEALEYLFLPLGAHYTRLGDNEKARTLYELAIQSHPAGPCDPALAGVYNNLGLTFWNEGRHRQALEVYRRGLACEGIPPLKRGLLLLSSAQSHFDLGAVDSAALLLRQAGELFREVQRSNPEAEGLKDYRSGVFLLQGKIAAERGRMSEARNLFQRALQLEVEARGTRRHRDIGKIQVALGELHLKRGAPEAALESFHRALQSVLPGFEDENPEALPRAGQLYAENTLLEALLGKAAAFGRLYARDSITARLDSALRCHHLALQVDTRLRLLLQYESSKLALLSKNREALETAIATARELYRCSRSKQYLFEGWYFAEQAKAGVLLENVLRNRLRSVDDSDPLLAELLRLRKRLSWFEKQLLLEPEAPQRPDWLAERQTLLERIEELERSLPSFSDLRRRLLELSPENLRAMLEAFPAQTVVEYFVGSRHIEIFSRSPAGKTQWHRQPQPEALADSTLHLLEMVRSRTALQTGKGYFPLSHSLYRHLLAPALDSPDSTQESLLLVPDAWLAFLPFEALTTTPHSGGWHDAPYLLRRFEVQYAYSLGVLDNQRRLPATASENLLQVAPRFSDGRRGLAPLEFSLDEAPSPCRSLRLDGSKATFDAFAKGASRYAVLHLSTHAGVDSSGANPRIEFHDRPAFLPEIYALPLQAELVVLSACQTALGRLREGEGVMSLSRAFTYAGARGLVASLWTINEAATADILQRFYGHLRQGIPKPAALTRAKRAYLLDPHVPPFQKSPYHWAGLVYLGDEGALAWRPCPFTGAWAGAAALAVLAFLGWVWWRRARGGDGPPSMGGKRPFGS